MTTRTPPPCLIALIRAIEARYRVTLAKDETK
jgi:hypothetical protein